MISWDGALLHHYTTIRKNLLTNIDLNMKNHLLVLLHHFMLHTMEVHYKKCMASDNFSTKKACWIMQVTKDFKILQIKWLMEKL